MGWNLAIAGGIFLGGLAYNKWVREKPKAVPIREFTIPRADEGAPYGLIYGRTVVRSPLLAWVGQPQALAVGVDDPDYPEFPGPFAYGLDMFFVVGITFESSASKLCSIYASDFEMPVVAPSIPEPPFVFVDTLEDLQGAGGYERDVRVAFISRNTDGVYLQGEVEFLNGSPTQTLVDGSDAPTTLTAERMQEFGAAGNEIPGFRGVLSVLLSRNPADGFGKIDGEPGFDDFVDGFLVGPATSPPAFAFEVSSYRSSGIASPTIGSTVDAGGGPLESNPVDALVDLLTGTYGKLGYPMTAIDLDSFRAAAIVLNTEGNGYSRAFEATANAADMIDEILAQIDGLLYADEHTGKWVLKLVRADYDPLGVMEINPNNCEALLDYTQGSWIGLTNKVRVNYLDRQEQYRDASATVQNHANAVGQSQVNEATFTYPGCKTRQLAETLAARDLAYTSRPLAKCRAMVNRSFAEINPGTVVAVTWPEAGLNRKLMRIAGVNRGSKSDSKITLDVVQDIFFQVGHVVVNTPIPSFPTESEA